MNPKITIAVDAKNKAIASLTGLVTVGAKVDVEITGLPSGILDWAATDKFTGKSLRFRVVDETGRDLVRFPLVEKSSASATDGDQWTVEAPGTANEKYKTNSGQATTPVVSFDTDVLRKEMRGLPFDAYREFGLILDSIVDAAQYAIGKIKVRQWATCPTEDPTVLPDWRAVVVEVLDARDDAEASAGVAETYKDAAEAAKNEAQVSASAALTSANIATQKANEASASATAADGSADDAEASKDAAIVAKTAAEAAKGLAEEAVGHYPRINAVTNKWQVWDATATPPSFVDTAVNATGPQGDAGISPHIDATTGHWFVGTTDTGVTARGPKGDDGEPGSQVSVSPTGTSTDEVRYITIDGTEKKLAGGGDGDVKHSDFASIDPQTVTIAQLATILKGQNA